MSGAPARARTRPRLLSRALTLAACAMLAAAIAAPPISAASPKSAGHGSVGHVSTARMTRVGTTNLRKSSGGSAEIGTNPETGPSAEPELDAKVSGARSASRVPAAHVPAPAPQSVVGAGSVTTGWDALDHTDQRNAGTGIYTQTNFSTEPPDMALCVGNGFVLQGVNSAIQVFDPSGTALTQPLSLNELFQATPAIDRVTGVYGDDIGDVKCYYDPGTQRFFVSSFRVPLNQDGSYSTTESHVVLAVSQTSDPTGSWTIYDLNTTDGDGTVATHPHCPCLADQPLIGADHNGFYITTNEYSLEPFGAYFNGGQVYAFSKAALVGGSGGALTGVHISGIPLAESTAYTLQPATTPAGGTYDSAHGGIEYFLSALDFNATLDNRIAVWALTGTSTLGSTNDVALTSAVISSEVYGQPPDAEQKSGPTPFLDLINAGGLGVRSHDHPELLAGNDDRMQQVAYADGKLWGNLNTVVKTPNGNVQVGNAWFVVQPGWKNGTLTGSMVNQGYVSVNRANVLYGVIAANNDGAAAMGFTLVGRDYYPSTAYVTLGSQGPASDVHLVAAGAAPEDGFTGYALFGGTGTARWGDYSAGMADEHGNLWLANQYIGARSSIDRTLYANWGTYIVEVAP